MPCERTPQNSASSTHRRLFSDLQTVYQKIIQTSGPLFPLRSKESRPKKYGQTSTHSRTRNLMLSADSGLTSNRATSARSSVEEIVIKPLRFHDRGLSSRSRLYAISAPSTPGSVITSDVGTSSVYSSNHAELSLNSDSSRLSRVRCKSSVSSAPAAIEYSEQSIRYVAEQVSLEQARQLKLRSNVTQHRIDRKYFVSGSKLLLQNQAFMEPKKSSVHATDNASSQPMAACSTIKVFNRRGLTVSGKRFKGRTLHSSPTNYNNGAEPADDVDEMSVPAVAIPTASVIRLDVLVTPSNMSIDSTDEKNVVSTEKPHQVSS